MEPCAFGRHQLGGSAQTAAISLRCPHPRSWPSIAPYPVRARLTTLATQKYPSYARQLIKNHLICHVNPIGNSLPPAPSRPHTRCGSKSDAPEPDPTLLLLVPLGRLLGLPLPPYLPTSALTPPQTHNSPLCCALSSRFKLVKGFNAEILSSQASRRYPTRREVCRQTDPRLSPPGPTVA